MSFGKYVDCRRLDLQIELCHPFFTPFVKCNKINNIIIEALICFPSLKLWCSNSQFFITCGHIICFSFEMFMIKYYSTSMSIVDECINWQSEEKKKPFLLCSYWNDVNFKNVTIINDIYRGGVVVKAQGVPARTLCRQNESNFA